MCCEFFINRLIPTRNFPLSDDGITNPALIAAPFRPILLTIIENNECFGEKANGHANETVLNGDVSIR